MSALTDLKQQAQNWYASKSAADKRALTLMALVLVPALIYFTLVFPLQRARNNLSADVLKQEAELATMQENVARVLASRGGAGGKLDRAGRRLPQLISDTAPQFNLIVSRLQPRGDNEVQIWLEDASFDDGLRWLHQMETGYGLQVASLNISSGKASGMVKLQLKLKDGT
ncbi:type II secretion system protein M [Permianibacter sp. IMCC34836]|uniref:type II secretion system protein GspM n=1 Tax=Permianibacter fluminis TaxID=2738515 RepID=UPI0015528062|nr:type II secretion system protein M [Permianibacter fluminis]NQD35671.1 type II secretion system protein M [Permianibacter fluminis]